MKKQISSTPLQEKIHPWQELPIIDVFNCGDGTAIWTMVMPIFNQEKRLIEVLSKVIEHAELPFNMILIDDASDDDSLERAKFFVADLQAKKTKKVVDILLVQNKTPIYETACDNQGFRLANTDYIIEIQSDIHVEEFGFDEKMIHAMNRLDLGAVSGRHVHNYSMLEGRRAWLKYPFSLLNLRFFHTKSEGEGRLGQKIFDRLESKAKMECFVGETVARGPWLVNKQDLERLSFLDERNFFLGNDDHDYHRRLFKELGKRVGYVPLDIYSISEDGATRKPREGINKLIYEYLLLNKKGSSAFRSFLRSYRPNRSIERHDL